MEERGPIRRSDLFRSLTSSAPELADLARVEAAVRARFGLSDRDIVLVTEEAGGTPGLPERITTILFWPEGQGRHRLRVFKPVASMTEDDLPRAWLRGALRDEGDGDCC